MGPPHSPIFETYGGHFCGRSETRFNGIGGPKLGPPKTQIETQNWCQFLSPSFDTICLPRDATISKYIHPACYRLKHGRPTWRDRFSNLNQAPFPGPWNHAEVTATSQIAPRVVQKAPLLIRSGKYLICVCEGVVLRQCDLIIRMSVVWRWEPFDARWTCILWGSASFCIGFFAQDTCMISWSPCTYLCIFSAVRARLCIFYCVANRCVYSAECDGCACRECHIHCSTRWCESCHWQWYLLERIEFGRVLSERSWFSMLEISELMSSTPTCPWWLDRHVPANTWCCFCVGTHAIPLGGTAAGGQRNVGIPTIPGCRRDRSRRRRDHFTCKFIGAGPHTPFGNYNNIPGGSGDVLEGVKIFLQMSCLPN